MKYKELLQHYAEVSKKADRETNRRYQASLKVLPRKREEYTNGEIEETEYGHFIQLDKEIREELVESQFRKLQLETELHGYFKREVEPDNSEYSLVGNGKVFTFREWLDEQIKNL